MQKTVSSPECPPSSQDGPRRNRVAAKPRLVSAQAGDWYEYLPGPPPAKPAQQAARKRRRAATRPETAASRWQPRLAAWMADAIRELAGWSSPPAGSVATWGGSLVRPMAAAIPSLASR